MLKPRCPPETRRPWLPRRWLNLRQSPRTARLQIPRHRRRRLSETAADPAAAVARWIADFRLCAERLRSAGLDDSAIAALAGFKVP